jgi:hypothetical protein
MENRPLEDWLEDASNAAINALVMAVIFKEPEGYEFWLDKFDGRKYPEGSFCEDVNCSMQIIEAVQRDISPLISVRMVRDKYGEIGKWHISFCDHEPYKSYGSGHNEDFCIAVVEAGLRTVMIDKPVVKLQDTEVKIVSKES